MQKKQFINNGKVFVSKNLRLKYTKCFLIFEVIPLNFFPLSLSPLLGNRINEGKHKLFGQNPEIFRSISAQSSSPRVCGSIPERGD